ncbi:helix-turn-helix transcriptional regulator [Qipengyuania sp. MTN3-11]|uniref:helix-turn-helix transcriptional regulator n=1 Tax=Qipengyuania sp. MTN3-11 TaxID=3056557 RepID=UPI0036F42C1C
MSWVANGRLLEAVHDEEAFVDVVRALAERIGARSFFGGLGMDGAVEGIAVDSGWWNADQIALYGTHFLDHDPCVAAMLSNWAPQSVLDLERMIGPRTFEHSRLYQDFIRPTGDDTFRSLGVPLEIGGHKGAVTFQRGKTQPMFGKDEIALLTNFAPELAGLFSARLKILTLMEAERSSREMADASGRPMLVLKTDGRLVRANATAEGLLREGRVLALHRGVVRPASIRARQRFVELLTGFDGRSPGLCGIRLDDGTGPADDAVAMMIRDGNVLLILSHIEPPCRAELLQMIYGLSAAESDIALRLHGGEFLTEIAESRCTSPHTVRQQVRNISQKMGCSRQIEIVRRISVLPAINTGDF